MPLESVHTNPTQTTDVLQAGISAAKTGQSQQARALFMQVLEQDEQNVAAWLWLSSVVDDLEEQQICLENVLAIDPGNTMAHKGLQLLEQKKAQTQSAAPPLFPENTAVATAMEKPLPPKPAPSQPAPAASNSRNNSSSSKYQRVGSKDSVPTTKTPTQGADTPSSSTVAKRSFKRLSLASEPALDVKPKKASATPEGDDPFGSEYGCPYCAAATQPDDNRCKACRGSLWLRKPKREKASFFFKILLTLQIINTLGSVLQIAGAVVMVSSASEFIEVPFASTFLLAILLIPTLFNVFLLIGLIKRWRVVYYLFIFQAILALGLVGAAVTVIGLESTTALIACGVPLILLVIAQLFLIFNLGDDFTFDKERILLRIDPDVELAATMMEQGHLHAKKNMWALAALHFRQASHRLADKLDPQLFLAVAYNNLKMYDRMAAPLQRAQLLDATDPRVKKLGALIEQRQTLAKREA